MSALSTTKNVLKLMRIKHYVKNGLVFLPLFFSINLLNLNMALTCVLGFISFCFASSMVYIVNDIRDAEKDRLHSTKSKRPIASGAISIPAAIVIEAVLAVLCGISLFIINSLMGTVFLVSYVIINLLYSFGGKNIPIIDIILLVSGFALRLMFGGVIINVGVSTWLFATVISAAFYMGFGKRRGEILKETEITREVNRKYSVDFLDKQLSVFQTLVLVFYSLWCIMNDGSAYANPGFEWSIIIVMLIFVRYSYDVHSASDGDPINVLLKDYLLLGLVALYCLYIFVIIYIPVDFLHKLGELV